MHCENWPLLHKFVFECLNTFKAWRVIVDNSDVNINCYPILFYIESNIEYEKLPLIIKNLEKSVKRYIDNESAVLL